jgi:hypothetical protein
LSSSLKKDTQLSGKCSVGHMQPENALGPSYFILLGLTVVESIYRGGISFAEHNRRKILRLRDVRGFLVFLFACFLSLQGSLLFNLLQPRHHSFRLGNLLVQPSQVNVKTES